MMGWRTLNLPSSFLLPSDQSLTAAKGGGEGKREIIYRWQVSTKTRETYGRSLKMELISEGREISCK